LSVAAKFKKINAEFGQIQSNLGKGEIAPRFYSPGGSSNLQMHASAESSTPKSILL